MIIDPKDQDIRGNYKLLIGSVLPRPIAFVSTISPNGTFNVAPFSFFTVVSSKPPVIAFSPSRRGSDGSTKDTYNNIIQSKEFTVNIVTEDIIEAVNNAATEYPPDVSEFDEIGLTPIRATKIKAPMVKESPIKFECILHQVVEVGPKGAGGGALILGEVVLFHIDEKLISDGRIDTKILKPVARLAGDEYTTLGRQFSLHRKPFNKEDKS